MDHGICLLSNIPVRSEPSHRSEMVTQLLFGEMFRITTVSGGWFRVRIGWDDYEGWIQDIQATQIDQAEYERLLQSPVPVVRDLMRSSVRTGSGTWFPVTAGSSLPGLSGDRMVISGETLLFDGTTMAGVDVSHPEPDGLALKQTRVPETNDVVRRSLCETALTFLNAPYQWGGRSPLGIDCSGFLQVVFKMNGIRLQRDSSRQASQGSDVSLLAEAQPADLLFFDNDAGTITHTGMLLDHSRIIHCSGKVKIDTVDHFGIYDESGRRYTHKLRIIRNMAD